VEGLTPVSPILLLFRLRLFFHVTIQLLS